MNASNLRAAFFSSPRCSRFSFVVAPEKLVLHLHLLLYLTFDIEFPTGVIWKVPTSYTVGRNLAVPCSVRWLPCLLEVSPGVVCIYHGVPRKKERRRNLPRCQWAPIYVAQSLCHTAVSRNWKVHLRSSQRQRMLRIFWSRNPMKWDDRFTSCNLSDHQKLSENLQSVVPTKTDYAMSTVKEVLTLSQSAAAMIPVPFLQEAIGVALKIIQVCEVRRILP